VTYTHVLWKYDKGLPNIPSPLLYRDVLYVLREGGILTTLDPKTGAVLKQARIDGALGSYFASPVAADGKIFTASQEGKVAVLNAGRQWTVASVNNFDEEIWSTPAMAGNQVIIRTQNALYCFKSGKRA
jgi:outer membrane protein assembly factor BamB